MRKVIHWAIANQGLVATSSDPRYNWPMSVDVYINDGRNRDPAAQYEWSETWVAPPSQSSIVRQSDNSTTRTDVVRAGETCGVGVRVGSCGVNVARRRGHALRGQWRARLGHGRDIHPDSAGRAAKGCARPNQQGGCRLSPTVDADDAGQVHDAGSGAISRRRFGYPRSSAELVICVCRSVWRALSSSSPGRPNAATDR